MKNNIFRLRSRQEGFTLLEILLVVAAIAILAGIVIVAINPSKQLGDTRNAQRRSDVNTILNAVYQYSIDNNGNLPSDIDGTLTEICTSTSTIGSCSASTVFLGELSLNEKYLVAIPVDPTGGVLLGGTGYRVGTTTNDRIIVDAPNSENATIQVKK